MPSSAEEKTSTPERRSRRRVVLIALLIAAVLGGVAYLAYDVIAGRARAQDDLEEAIGLVRDADEAVLAVDDVVQAEVEPGLGPRADDAGEMVPGALDDVREAVDLVDGAYDRLPETDQEIADAVRASAEARKDMLQVATEIVEMNADAARAVEPARRGVDAILAAADLETRAVERFNEHTEEGVTASTQLTQQAIDEYEAAKAAFEQAGERFEAADFDPFIDYVEAKTELLGFSKRVDETWLSGDVEEANDMLDELSTREEEVAALAAELPESGTAPIADAYDELAAEPTQEYLDARKEATEADEELRRLLGSGDANEEEDADKDAEEG